MGSKKNKVKRILAPSTPPNPNNAVDDDLVDDLFAELDSRDKTVQQRQEPASASAQTAPASPDKMGSKSRFKARQVRLVPSRPIRAGDKRLIPRQGKLQRSLTSNLRRMPTPTPNWSAKPKRKSARSTRYATSSPSTCTRCAPIHPLNNVLAHAIADQPGRSLSVLRRRRPTGHPQPRPTARSALRIYARRSRRIHASAPGGFCAVPAPPRG